MHDTGTKTLLGVTFGPAGQDEGERALDLLAAHPATAHHIAYEARAAVRRRRAAGRARRSRRPGRSSTPKGTSARSCGRIVTSPEFFAPEARRAKVKTPLEFVVSAVRATGATVVNAQPLVAALQNLGMPLYGCQPPTGYSMTADAWVNTGALLNRMNFAVQLVGGRPHRAAGQRRPRRRRGRMRAADAGRTRPARAPARPGAAPSGSTSRALAPDTDERRAAMPWSRPLLGGDGLRRDAPDAGARRHAADT